MKDNQYYFIDGALSSVDENMPDGAYMQVCIDTIESVWKEFYGNEVDGHSKYMEYLEHGNKLRKNDFIIT